MKRKRSRTIVIEMRLTDSPAYWELKSHGIRVLFRFLEKRQLRKTKDSKGNENWVITNNGELVYTYKEATRDGMSRNQFRNAIDDLIARGFLEINNQGTGPGDPSTYKLCERWQAYGTENFIAAPKRRKNKSKNMGWSKYNRQKKQKLGIENDTSSGDEIDTSLPIKDKYRVIFLTPEKRTNYGVLN